MYCIYLLHLQRLEAEVRDRRHRIAYLKQAAFLLLEQTSGPIHDHVQKMLDEFTAFCVKVFDQLDVCKASAHSLSVNEVYFC